MGKEKVVIIGSGNWSVWLLPSITGRVTHGLGGRGSAIARIVGQNVTKHSDNFDSRVPCWVFEEEVGPPLLQLKTNRLIRRAS